MSKILFALGLALVAGADARADETLTRSLKACLSEMVRANADANWRWNEGSPETQAPVARGGTRACPRDAWAPHVSALVTTTTREMAILKLRVDGSDDSLLGMNCRGANAEALFEAMARYVVHEDQRRWASGDLVMTRNVGEGLECMRKVRNADDSEVNYYWCNIVLRGLSSNFVKALDL